MDGYDGDSLTMTSSFLYTSELLTLLDCCSVGNVSVTSVQHCVEFFVKMKEKMKNQIFQPDSFAPIVGMFGKIREGRRQERKEDEATFLKALLLLLLLTMLNQFPVRN